MKALTLILFIFLLSISSQAKVIRIGGLIHIPPYFHKLDDTGIELDILKASFSKIGYDEVLTVFASNKRAIQLLMNDNIDTLVSNAKDISLSNNKKVFSSVEILDFVDCAITLKSSNLEIKKTADLKDKAIWAFSGAREALGNEFFNITKNNKLYKESINQLTQPRALMKNRIDIAVSDINIFSHQAKLEGYNKSDFIFTSISPKTPRSLRFKNKKLRDLFNRGLKLIRKDGTYRKILKKYNDHYRASCG